MFPRSGIGCHPKKCNPCCWTKCYLCGLDRGRRPLRRDSRITVGTSIARPPSAAVISTFAGRHDGRPYDRRGSLCGDIGAPHPPLARSPFPRGGRLGAVNAIAYICIHMYTKYKYNYSRNSIPDTAQPQPRPDPDAETPSHSKTNPSSQPERKRGGVVENVENCAVWRFRGLNVSFFTFSTN